MSWRWCWGPVLFNCTLNVHQWKLLEWSQTIYQLVFLCCEKERCLWSISCLGLNNRHTCTTCYLTSGLVLCLTCMKFIFPSYKLDYKRYTTTLFVAYVIWGLFLAMLGYVGYARAYGRWMESYLKSMLGISSADQENKFVLVFRHLISSSFMSSGNLDLILTTFKGLCLTKISMNSPLSFNNSTFILSSKLNVFLSS